MVFGLGDCFSATFTHTNSQAHILFYYLRKRIFVASLLSNLLLESSAGFRPCDDLMMTVIAVFSATSGF